MGLDDEDTPTGAIIALVLITITVFVISVLTFESCSEFSYDEEYRVCDGVEIEIVAPHGQEDPCYDIQGNAKFSFRNVGEFNLEGINIEHEDVNMNKSEYYPRQSRGDITIDLGLQRGQIFRPINVSPIVYFEDFDDEIICYRATERIRTLESCSDDN